MEALKEYLLSVTCAAVICGIALKILNSKGTCAVIGKMMGGIFLAVVVISPIAGIEFDLWSDWTDTFSQEASKAVAAGEREAEYAMAEIIKEQTRTYIMEKAKQMDLQLEVSVDVSKDALPVPESVRIVGKLSPYAKNKLQEMIATDLGIPKEKQQWT